MRSDILPTIKHIILPSCYLEFIFRLLYGYMLQGISIRIAHFVVFLGQNSDSHH